MIIKIVGLLGLKNWRKGIIPNDNLKKLVQTAAGSGLFCAD